MPGSSACLPTTTGCCMRRTARKRSCATCSPTRRHAAWAATASRTRFVEVVLNGRYHGVYVLMEKLKLHDQRVRADRASGRLLEWTSFDKLAGEDKPFRLTEANVPVLHNDPERDELGRQERADVRRSLQAADRAIHGPPGRTRCPAGAPTSMSRRQSTTCWSTSSSRTGTRSTRAPT
ncbi:CotH kinase family protein [Nocardioides sp. B-3]|uniref:CotH kinase family protein n=1 Tax=Nocardioides sp. B-3 TaxID=2895565 RepID=UPI003FA5D981